MISANGIDRSCEGDMAVKWWRRKERERDLERELRSHLEAEAKERRGRGADAVH